MLTDKARSVCVSDLDPEKHLGQRLRRVCRGEAQDDLPAPSKLNISSHYNAATESEGAVMTVLGCCGCGRNKNELARPAQLLIHLGVPSPPLSPGVCVDPSDVQNLAAVGRDRGQPSGGTKSACRGGLGKG